MIWSGLSWGAAEIKKETFNTSKPISVVCSSEEKDNLKLIADIYEVSYE
jgi:hypothetical protein